MAIDLKRVDNADGSHYTLMGPYDNGLYVRYDYPSGADANTQASKVTSVQSDGVTAVPDPPGSKPGQAARDSGAIKGTTWEGGSSLGNFKDAIGLGSSPGPADVSKGSIENPNPAYQTKENFGTRTDLLGYDAADRAAGDKVAGNQNNLISEYNKTIQDPNAPSQARTMLAINNDLNNRSALGSAAGVGGANAFSARRQALNTIANNNIGTAQAAALARTKEVSDAQAGENSTLSNQAIVNQSRQNSDLSGSLGFAKEADDSAQKQEEEKIKAKQNDQAGKQSFFNRLTNAVSSGMGAGLGGK